MELLESRCVLSGFGMPPMMGVHSDFGHEIDGDRFEESRFEPVLPVDHEILVGRGDNGVREVRPLIGRLARTGKAAENDEFFHRTPKD